MVCLTVKSLWPVWLISRGTGSKSNSWKQNFPWLKQSRLICSLCKVFKWANYTFLTASWWITCTGNPILLDIDLTLFHLFLWRWGKGEQSLQGDCELFDHRKIWFLFFGFFFVHCVIIIVSNRNTIHKVFWVKKIDDSTLYTHIFNSVSSSQVLFLDLFHSK